MKIEVVGKGPVLHGIKEGQTLNIPPGVHITSDEDPSSIVTLELAKFLIATTNGHVIEYVPPTVKPVEIVVEVSQQSAQQKMQEALDVAQKAQQNRIDQAKSDREKEKAFSKSR